MTTRTLPALPIRPIIGMVHLKPLPGTPRYNGSPTEILDAALADALALTSGGIDAIMVENYGDVPFRKTGVEPHTIAVMALIAAEIRRETGRPIGINVLRNDAAAAIGIATACGADFVRINVHTGAMVTDQGIIEGDAATTLAYRDRLRSEVAIMADVHVKHALPQVPFPIEESAADAAQRGLADALIVTGTRTGGAIEREELRRVRRAVNVPVLVGSGVTAETAATILSECDGAIVGSWLKQEGDHLRPVDPERVLRLMSIVRSL